MKILYITTELEPGGAEFCLLELAKRLIQDIHNQVMVVALKGDGVIGDALRDLAIPVHCLGMNRPWQGYRLLELHRLMRSFRPDLVHAFLFHGNLAARLTAPLARVPALITSIRVAEMDRSHHRLIESLGAMMSDRVLAVSHAARNKTLSFPAARHNCTVITNGVDTRFFTPAGPGERHPKPLIITAARLAPQKGIDLALQAIAALPEEQQPDYWIAGTGPLRAPLLALAERLGISDRVRFLGTISKKDMPALYRKAWISLLPSHWEGMPNTALEALSTGLPLLATAVDGTRDLIENNKNGMAIPPGDQPTMTRALSRLLEDRALRSRLSLAARQSVLSRSTERMAERTFAVYNNVLSGKKQ